MLPPELVDHIFSFLQPYPSALKACSQAHPLYSRLAERHLFANILIDPPSVIESHRQLSANSRLLDYPRSLRIYGGSKSVSNPLLALSIVEMIPRMANLTSLKLYSLPCPYDRYQDFISMFATCLQQSSIEQLNLSCIYNFPLSVLDNSKTIKKLTLFDCTARKEISSSPPSKQSLETLVLAVGEHPDIHLWALCRITHLTSLELRFWWMDDHPSAFPDVLTACSKSLTSLRLGIEYYTSTWIYSTDHHMCRWINDGPQFPFTLSALVHLKSLSIFSPIDITTIGIECALPEIIRIIKTAPAIQYIVLDFHCGGQICIESLGRLDWSLIDCLHTHPCLELCFTGEGEPGFSIPPETILDALAANEALMDLVKRGLVVLKSEQWLKEDP